MTEPSTMRRWRAALAPLALNLIVATALRLILPMTLASGGERHLYYLMSVLTPLPGCDTFHCFRLVPPIVARLLPFGGLDAFIAAGVLLQAFSATLVWQIAERLHGSTRVGLLAAGWFWVVWGPIASFWDPLLIADPVQVFWSLMALRLLLDGHYAVALPFVVLGAGVKESVVCVPMIYTAYVVLVRDEARRKRVWLAMLVVAPAIAWVLLRRYLIDQFGYVSTADAPYLRHPYTFSVWLPQLSTWPRSLGIAALYVFAGFGAAWVLGILGLRHANRRQLALTLAAVPPMLFIASYQEPHRALSNFPYALMIPAAVYVARLPWPLVASLFVTNAAFTVRMGATVAWLPRAPIILALMIPLIGWCVWLRERAPREPAAAGTTTHHEGTKRPEDHGFQLIPALAVGLMALVAVPLARGFWAVGRVTTLSVPTPGIDTVVDDDRGTPALAVSPDGQRTAFVGRGPNRRRQLWIWRVGSASGEPIAGTEEASAPFWAPDGRAIGFFAGGKLKTVVTADGSVAVLADAPGAHGGAWSSAGAIVFAADPGPVLYQVPEAGGIVARLTTAGPIDGYAHLWPSFLPDGEHFLYAARGEHGTDTTLRAGSLHSTGTRFVSGNGDGVSYAAPGFLLHSVNGDLWASPFDARRLTMLDARARVARRIVMAPSISRAAASASAQTLAFATATTPAAPDAGHPRLQWLDRDGRLLRPIDEGRGDEGAMAVSLSPDGTRVAVSRDRQGIWVGDTPLEHWSAFSPAGDATTAPVWSPDSAQIAYASRAPDGGHTWRIDTQATSGAARVRTIATFKAGTAALLDWSPDGRTLLVWAPTDAGQDVWALAADGRSPPVPLFPGTPGAEDAQFSPDGRWIAYSAPGRDRRDVYIEPYPATGARWPVAPYGGDEPRWSADGRELTYIHDRFLMAVAIRADGEIHASDARKLFEVRLRVGPQSAFQYARSHDSRFLVIAYAQPERTASVTVVLNWLRGVAIVPAGR